MPSCAFRILIFLSWSVFFLLHGCLGSIPANYDTEKWIDEVLLHDGRTVDVYRTYRGSRQPQTLTGIFASVLFKPYNHFDLALVNPESGKKINWSGGNGIEPVMFDVFEGVPYLVVYANHLFSEIKPYGCIEIPFVVLRYDNKADTWTSIKGSQAPTPLRANLWSGDHSADDKRRETKERILSQNKALEQRSKGSFSVSIPKNYDSWVNEHKDEFKNQPNLEGCYPPKARPIDNVSHPQHPFAPAELINFEVLEVKEYSPAWKILAHTSDEKSPWSDLVWDEESDVLCKRLLTRADSRAPLMEGWILFANDSTQKNRARYTGSPICKSEGVWFPDYSQGKEKMYLAKFSLDGVFKYRVGFTPPKYTSGFVGHMTKSFKAENGYLYFDWWNSSSEGYYRFVSRTMKVRVKEPR